MHETAAIGVGDIFDLYQAALVRLPVPQPRAAARPGPDLSAISASYDVILLDAFGVLNIGEAAIPGARARIATLRDAGKRLMVVTNAASYPKRILIERYHRLGFDFSADEVMSSRETLLAALGDQPVRRWGVMADPRWPLEEFSDFDTHLMGDDPGEYDTAEGFLLLGSGAWTAARQAMLAETLTRRPRPVLVGNPDIVAPRTGGYSFEPGHYAHRLAVIDGVTPRFFGEPFGAVFARALARVGVAPDRALMVGDTLHTDILGGNTAGLATALVTETGSLHRGDVTRAIAESGITPTHILPRI